MSDRVRRIIGWWEIGCGLIGIGMFAALFFRRFPSSAAILENFDWINYWGGVCFFSFVFAAGRALLRNRPWGLGASFLSQAVQVVSFAFLNGPIVKIAAGPMLGIIVSSTMAKVSAGFNSAFFLGTRLKGPDFEVTFNALAAIWAIWLFRELMRRRRALATAAA